jgi:hypothetical protein
MDEEPLPFTFVDVERLGSTVDARYGYGIFRTGTNKISLKVVLLHVKVLSAPRSESVTHLYNNKAIG